VVGLLVAGREDVVLRLYPHDVVFAAKAMFFVEQDFIGFMPERFTQANAHHALHRMLFEHASSRACS
jgi:hypothetical protein